MELTIWKMVYLAYRIAPLMIVIYFIFASVINQDFKGLAYLVGLIFACFLTLFIGNSILPDTILDYDIDFNSPVCNSFTIGMGGTYSNKFPFSIVVFSFTLFYILYAIIDNGLIMNNVPFLVIFPALILFDIIWNKLNRCANFWGMSATLIISSGFGYLYAYFMSSSGLVNLMYMTGSINNETCQIASKTQFKCSVKAI